MACVYIVVIHAHKRTHQEVFTINPLHYAVHALYPATEVISHSLSNIAVNDDIIIIQISQVSRDYSRNQIMDLYAAKGSGAIENASRKVIGITGSSESADKTLSIYKNSDGDLFEVALNWTPSFRLRKKPTVYSKALGRSFTIVED